MPTTYTHDLFGKLVYKKLPADLKKCIRENPVAYRIGLHGPDILFYYRPFSKNRVNGLGSAMHREIAAPFFDRQQERVTEDAETASYVFGFICHFMLDSKCHPYIGAYMKETGAAHDEIETDLDRMLMEKTGKDPYSYRPAAFLKVLRKNQGKAERLMEKIAEVIGQVSREDIRRSLKGMTFYTGVMVCRCEVKRRLILGVLKAVGAYDSMQGHIMRKKRPKRCLRSTAVLEEIFEETISETAEMIADYWEKAKKKERVGERFYRNYE